MTRREAAAAAAVPFSTYYRWAESETFRDECERQEALCELTLVLRLQQAAMRGSYRAATFLLERRYPARWGPREKVELSGPQGSSIRMAVEQMTDEQIEERLAFLARIAGETSEDRSLT